MLVCLFILSYISVVFRDDCRHETGARHFFSQIFALLIKRWHVLQRQYTFIFGFFIFPIIIEILIVSIFPTPKSVQASLAQNGRVKDAQITFVPSIYNPHTVVIYSNDNTSNARVNLMNSIQSTGATINEIYTDRVLNYVGDNYLANEDFFINKYQMAFALYNNLTGSIPSLFFKSYFSTVNYHTMPTSLNIISTNLFQYYANSSAKKIITTNQPILTPSISYTALQQFFDTIYCFDTLPLSLFNFLNSILAGLFISILIIPLIQERVNHSKDLQLLSNLTKQIYWLSNIIFDLIVCFILCGLLTIIVTVISINWK